MAWETSRGNNGRTGIVVSDYADNDFIVLASREKLFRLDLEGRVLSDTSAPDSEGLTHIVVDGNRIVGYRENGHSHVFDLNGRYQFSTSEIDNAGRNFDSDLEPLVSQGKIVFFYSFEDKNEPSSYTTRLDGKPVGTHKLIVECYDINGKKKWEYKCNAENVKQPIVVGNEVYIGSRIGLMQLDIESGSVRRFYPDDKPQGSIIGSPMFIGNKVYLCSSTGSGIELVRMDVDGYITGKNPLPGLIRNWASNGRQILLQTIEGHNHLVNKDNAKVLWTNPTYSPSIPVINDNGFFLMSKDNTNKRSIYSYSIDGRLRFVHREIHTPWNNFAVDERMILYGSLDGKLRAIDHFNRELFEFDPGACGHAPCSSVIVKKRHN